MRRHDNCCLTQYKPGDKPINARIDIQGRGEADDRSLGKRQWTVLLSIVTVLSLAACDREQRDANSLPAPGEEKQPETPSRPPFVDTPGEHPPPVVRSYPTGERPADPHLAKGYDVYRKACSACHESGVTTQAPPITDVSAWRPRIAKGKETLYANAINGYTGEVGFMPPKGGSPGSWSDEEVRAAVDYMVHVVRRVEERLEAQRQSQGGAKP